MSDAHDQIRNLLGLYCERMDAGDFDAMASLFAEGRLTDDSGSVICEGAEAMARIWHGQTILYDGSPRTKHLTVNPIIEVDETAGTSTARSSYVVYQGLAGYASEKFPLQVIITGRYRDQFKRGDDGTWRWDERRYFIDHLGDLSHHLSRTLEPSPQPAS
jgi:3-phenylpropionate/cinnamic acid dioxygenase small subunit